MLRFVFWAFTVLIAVTVVLAQDKTSKSRENPASKGTQDDASGPIDFARARELFQKRQRGDRLSAAEDAYVRRALEARRKQGGGGGGGGGLTPRDQTGLVPLSEMSGQDRYQGEDGGLYGAGKNVPPEKHLRAARSLLDQIRPLDREGQPSANGRVVLISISMSNATQEFSAFKRLADADPVKSAQLTIVDCAQGGRAMAQWVSPQAEPWSVAVRRIANANVTPEQVQVAWIKLANMGPRGSLQEHGKKLQSDTLAVIQNAKARFPNLRIVYLASRIYGGYATTPLNPEPYAYESAFAVRWLIQDQIEGSAELNYSADRGPVKAPLLLWGPYLWADGVQPRKGDDLVWKRSDLAEDGTHPTRSGQDKVAQLLLEFFKTDPLAKSWFRQSDRTR